MSTALTITTWVWQWHRVLSFFGIVLKVSHLSNKYSSNRQLYLSTGHVTESNVFNPKYQVLFLKKTENNLIQLTSASYVLASFFSSRYWCVPSYLDSKYFQLNWLFILPHYSANNWTIKLKKKKNRREPSTWQTNWTLKRKSTTFFFSGRYVKNPANNLTYRDSILKSMVIFNRAKMSNDNKNKEKEETHTITLAFKYNSKFKYTCFQK